jgi:hypothetical protein
MNRLELERIDALNSLRIAYDMFKLTGVSEIGPCEKAYTAACEALARAEQDEWLANPS